MWQLMLIHIAKQNLLRNKQNYKDGVLNMLHLNYTEIYKINIHKLLFKIHF